MIEKMVSYGVNNTTANKNGYIAMWSNGGKNWGIFGMMTKKGERINLDANMFLIPSEDKEMIKEILSFFQILPLYYYSTEARIQGETPPNVNEIVNELRARAKLDNSKWGMLSFLELWITLTKRVNTLFFLIFD